MSTPPTPPFRSRREIHAGEKRIYSDVPRQAERDMTPTPVRGTRIPSPAPTEAPTPTAQQPQPRLQDEATAPARNQREAALPSFDDVTRGRNETSSVATPREEAPEAPAEETTGMRSRRLAAERRAARRRKRNRRIRSFIIILVLLALVSGAGYFAFTQLVTASSTASDDYPGPGSGEVQITIENDATGRDIAQTLVAADVVQSVGAFVRQFESNRAATSIRPGTYRMRMHMSAAGALAALLDETNRVDSTITVTSTMKMSEVRARIASIMEVNESDVDAAFADTEGIGLPAEAGGSVEGWLLPGSYEVAEGDTPTTVVRRMVQGTIEELDRLGVASDQRQIVLIKASIVDGEMYIDRYMPQVARVIENRLVDVNGETRGMLGMDSTVLYGVGKTGGVPTQEDLNNDNPYNTRLHAGLPPTPIGQPTERAIRAVLNPADGDWLYFVTINLDTGETLFASTFAEQEQNQQLFQQYCTANPGRC